MDPLSMALLAGGATAAGSIPSAFAPRRTDKAQKKRLKELERMEEMGALGLTEQQRASARQQLEAPVVQAQQRADAEMRRLATANAQPGQQLQQAMLAQQNRDATEAQIASSILGLDLQEQAKQQQELKDLRGVLDERRVEKINALTAPVTEGAMGFAQAKTLQSLFNQQPAERIESLSKETGLSPSAIKRSFPVLGSGEFVLGGQGKITPYTGEPMTYTPAFPDAPDPRIVSTNPTGKTRQGFEPDMNSLAMQGITIDSINPIVLQQLRQDLAGRATDEEILRIYNNLYR